MLAYNIRVVKMIESVESLPSCNYDIIIRVIITINNVTSSLFSHPKAVLLILILHEELLILPFNINQMLSASFQSRRMFLREYSTSFIINIRNVLLMSQSITEFLFLHMPDLII